MIDAAARHVLDPVLDRVAAGLANLGLRADAVTAVGFGLGVIAWTCLAVREYELALAFIALNRIADGIDGPLARRLGPTDRGGFLDIVCDFVFYAGVPFFFAVGNPEVALPAAFLGFAFMGTGGSFLAFATIAAKRKLSTDVRGPKAFYYLGGLTEGTETIALFMLVCLKPEWFAAAAWTFGGLCWVTTATRVFAGYTAFRDPPSGDV